MPQFNGTGPQGLGAMTGRGLGYCVVDLGKNKDSGKTSGKEVSRMPKGDGTGPAGFGPMTGRAAGFCAGYPTPGYLTPVPGRGGFGQGMGFLGRGGGRGRRNRYYVTGLPGWARWAGLNPPAYGFWNAPGPRPGETVITPEDESAMLQEEAQFLKARVTEIENRIAEMEKVRSRESSEKDDR